MMKLLNTLRRSTFIALAFAMISMPGAQVFADGSTPCTPPASTSPGVNRPTGASAPAYTYQCEGAYAGKWLSAYYVFDPADNSTTPLYDLDYHYDCSAGKWYMTDWVYSPVKDAYYKTVVATSAPAGQTTDCPVVPSNTGSNSPAKTASPTPLSSASPTQNAAGSGTTLTGTNNSNVNNLTNATMTNGIVSFSVSGVATVSGNTTGGSATSGNAQTIANIINMLQSSSNILGSPNMITFTANINGDVNGDLLLDPARLGAVQPANSSTTLDNNLTVNNSTNASITNNIDLGANSGNATVSGNTKAGNATTGTADAVANIVNVLNSAVTAGKSFMGVININGNLNGDILLPPDFVNTLLASNVPRYNVNTAELNTNVTVNNTANQTINNNVGASARSGSANVSGNTSGGNATSGLANTNLTVFNLTGSNVVASNDLLVFVNVLGTWYGMIMNAPAGTTAASLGGGVTSNTTVNNTATLNNTNNQAINNNVNVAAQSGNASVTHNTSGGNATSGNATASVNLVNMINDSLSLNGWFGLLFINVFGTWNGSFGVNTSAGNPVTTQSAGGASGGSSPMFRFAPISTMPGGSNKAYNPGSGTYSGSASGSSSDGSVLAAKTVKGDLKTPSTDNGILPANKAANQLLLPILGTTFAFLILVVGERNRFIRHG